MKSYTPTMSNTVRPLLVAVLLLAPTGRGNETGTESLLELEKPGIDKIAQLTAAEHSTILFAIGDHLIGYAKDGHIEWINANVAPDVLHVAGPTRHCQMTGCV